MKHRFNCQQIPPMNADLQLGIRLRDLRDLRVFLSDPSMA
jgi:hypothetical protein